VCEALEIDPHRLRALITRWEKNKLPSDKPRMIRRSAVSIDGPLVSRGRKRAPRGL
jgi:hypothetical protein